MFESCEWWAGGGELTCVMIWRICAEKRESKISRSDYSRSCDGNIISPEQAVGEQLALRLVIFAEKTRGATLLHVSCVWKL